MNLFNPIRFSSVYLRLGYMLDKKQRTLFGRFTARSWYESSFNSLRESGVVSFNALFLRKSGPLVYCKIPTNWSFFMLRSSYVTRLDAFGHCRRLSVYKLSCLTTSTKAGGYQRTCVFSPKKQTITTCYVRIRFKLTVSP